MKDHYGYIRGTEDNTGEHVDVFVDPQPEAGQVFVIDQVIDGKFDEPKVMIGYGGEQEGIFDREGDAMNEQLLTAGLMLMNTLLQRAMQVSAQIQAGTLDRAYLDAQLIEDVEARQMQLAALERARAEGR
ncbi:hypothetical protein [Steroidobacter denitrificans]|nr:hypothetical protein [Steroidobacter denitrificans]